MSYLKMVSLQVVYPGLQWQATQVLKMYNVDKISEVFYTVFCSCDFDFWGLQVGRKYVK